MEGFSAESSLPRTEAPRKPWHGLHKALADPLRIRLLEWLFEAPRSARELADCAGLPADRLYYHLGQLERAGLIEVAEYRSLARGKVERVYAPAQTEPPGDDADPEETAALLGSMLQATAMDITAACRARQAGGRREIDLHLGTLRLTDEALAELPADRWRWWLIANAPETADVDFSVRRFAADTDKDLADVFGNLVIRLVRFAVQAFDGRVPAGGEPAERERRLAVEIGGSVERLRTHHEAVELRRAAAETRAIWSRANAYLQDAAPWASIKSDRAQAAVAARTALALVHLGAVVAWSIVPDLAGRVLRLFGDETSVPRWPERPAEQLLATDGGRPIDPIAPLVTKLTDAEVDRLTVRFAGGV